MGEGKKILLWKSFIMDAREQMYWSDEKLSLDAAPYLGELPEGVTRTVEGRRSIYERNGVKYTFMPQTEEPLFLYPVSPRKGEPIPVKVAGPLRWEPAFDEGPFFDGPFKEVINYGSKRRKKDS